MEKMTSKSTRERERKRSRRRDKIGKKICIRCGGTRKLQGGRKQ
jgi:transcription elongation factor